MHSDFTHSGGVHPAGPTDAQRPTVQQHELKHDVFFHLDPSQFTALRVSLATLIEVIRKGFSTMTQEVDDLVAEVAKVGPAINKLEAAVTAALANSGMSAADKAAITQAIADLKADLVDADDGVDEGAAPPVGPT